MYLFMYEKKDWNLMKRILEFLKNSEIDANKN